jgi:hypothetical protein
MGRWFPGFFALLLEGGRFHRFASYTGAEVRSAVLAGRELAVEVRGRVDGRPRELTLRAVRSHEGVLLAPVEGAMDRRIGESIDARLSVRLADGDGRTLFEGEGRSAGLEVVGDVASLGVSVRDPSPGPRA